MRGKGGNAQVYGNAQGITPAYAGKSHCFAVPRVDVKDHPRLCGEKSPATITGKYQAGSPPPMRGKVSRQENIGINDRITPAYAGKSFQYFSRRKFV